MEERIKVLEGKVEQMGNILKVVAQWALINKQFMDGLNIQKPVEQPKQEEEKK